MCFPCSETRSKRPEAVDNQLKGKAVRREEPALEDSSLEPTANDSASGPQVVDDQPDLTNGLLQSSGESSDGASLHILSKSAVP